MNSCAAYAGGTVDGGLGSIEKYWEVLGGFGRIHCRLYCKQYGMILQCGFKAAKNSSQNFPKPLKISQNLPLPPRTTLRRAGGRTPTPHTFSGAAYAGSTVDGGLGSIEKYWEELGGFGRKYCRLYCKQYGVILLTGLKRQRKLPKFPKASQNLPKSPTAATHNFAPRRRQNPTPPQRTTPRRESGRTPTPHTRAIRLMAAWDVLRSIGKYWEGLGGYIAAFTVSNTV